MRFTGATCMVLVWDLIGQTVREHYIVAYFTINLLIFTDMCSFNQIIHLKRKKKWKYSLYVLCNLYNEQKIHDYLNHIYHRSTV